MVLKIVLIMVVLIIFNKCILYVNFNSAFIQIFHMRFKENSFLVLQMIHDI
jgi:hypothetical protein